MKARTTKEISGRSIKTIPIGTEFEVKQIGTKPAYSSCSGLGVTLIWNDEYELIPTCQNCGTPLVTIKGAGVCPQEFPDYVKKNS